MRQSIRDIDERLKVPREMSLDELVEYLSEDELLEVTPKNLRLRKRILNTHDRLRYQKRVKIVSCNGLIFVTVPKNTRLAVNWCLVYTS